MNYRDWLTVPAVLVIGFTCTAAYAESAPVLEITPNSQSEPLVVRGKSGGGNGSDCGNIAATPNQVIQVTEPLPYLRLSVESSAKTTLLIEGPGGRFCVLADSYSGGSPEISGYWEKGKYSLYVGDHTQEQHPYTLSISQTNNSTQKSQKSKL